MDRSGANYFSLIVLFMVGGIIVVFMIYGIGVPPASVIGTVTAICLLLAIGKVVISLFSVRRR